MRDINNYTRSYAKGKSFEFTEWSKLNNYTNSRIKQDFVTYGGSLYACICDVAAGNESPDKDTIHWKLAVAGSFTERKDLIKLLGFEPVNPNTTNNFTKSQTFDAGINLNNTQIRKVKNPENDNDAANKQYVDDTVKTNIATQITYTELKSLRDSGNLVPGTQYRIIDFATIVDSQFDSFELPFDIVVTALSSTRLSSSASALHRDISDDTLKNFDLSSWKLKYSLDNDTDKFNWASEDGKGVIYGMIDEFNNSAPFDFYSIYPEGNPLFPYPFTGSSYNNTIKEDRGEGGQMLLPIVYFTEDVNNIEVSKNSEGKFVAYNVADLFVSELSDNPSPDNPSPYSTIGTIDTISTIYYIGEI